MSSSLLVSGIGPIYKFEIENDGSELPLDYDVAAMETFFNKRPLEVMYRTGEIFAELLPYFTRAFIWEYLIRSVAGLVQIHYFDTYIYEQRTNEHFQEKDPGPRGAAAEVRGGVAGDAHQAGPQLHQARPGRVHQVTNSEMNINLYKARVQT